MNRLNLVGSTVGETVGPEGAEGDTVLYTTGGARSGD